MGKLLASQSRELMLAEANAVGVARLLGLMPDVESRYDVAVFGLTRAYGGGPYIRILIHLKDGGDPDRALADLLAALGDAEPAWVAFDGTFVRYAFEYEVAAQSASSKGRLIDWHRVEGGLFLKVWHMPGNGRPSGTYEVALAERWSGIPVEVHVEAPFAAFGGKIVSTHKDGGPAGVGHRPATDASHPDVFKWSPRLPGWRYFYHETSSTMFRPVEDEPMPASLERHSRDARLRYNEEARTI